MMLPPDDCTIENALSNKALDAPYYLMLLFPGNHRLLIQAIERLLIFPRTSIRHHVCSIVYNPEIGTMVEVCTATAVPEERDLTLIPSGKQSFVFRAYGQG